MELIKKSGDYVALYHTYISSLENDGVYLIGILDKNLNKVVEIKWKANEKAKLLHSFYIEILDEYKNIPSIHNLMTDCFYEIYIKYFGYFSFDYFCLDKRLLKLIERKVKYKKLPSQVIEKHILPSLLKFQLENYKKLNNERCWTHEGLQVILSRQSCK
ncbi:hypothetical protein [Thermaerobacillus caldiproteolyticus]|uniref:hypothetical protein n=1 Tax=Thermaerobacillus caldiproteolyticus TaxID=247480 RepID=UPI0018F1A60E|nr:hypothetical protein [Anoxybacillus caldiproteolyticus]